MSDSNRESKTVVINLQGTEIPGDEKPLPKLLQDTSRSTDAAPDPFINDDVVDVESVYDLSLVARGTGVKTRAESDNKRLLALEAEDGTTLFIRADKLREEIGRLYPEAIRDDDSLDLSVLRDREATSRGLVDWVWSKLSVIGLKPDLIIDEARARAQAWVLEKLGERFKEQVEELSGFSASALGAKALMWAIESRICNPGLYWWHENELSAADHIPEADPILEKAAAQGPMLVFIHGTASHTTGSFGELREPAGASDWEPIEKRFGDRIYGYEHRTFSESPIDNAIGLARTLPKGAQLTLVTHSRGGLVGDLLCLAGLPEELINNYRHHSTSDETDEETASGFLNSQVIQEEQRKLSELRTLLEEKNFRIERYIRVACPANGTTLLSDNLELFLSGLLSLMNSLVGAVTGPGSAPVLSAFKRIVLEIADKRLDPALVPGIEAMLTDAPMATLLARSERKQGIAMAVIAGDIEGRSLLKRLGLMFTDWMFFDQHDNDLVVDTNSMYAGMARHAGTRYLFDQGPGVNHFSYFGNRLTREALGDWLTHQNPEGIAAFSPLETRREIEGATRALARARPAADNTRPVVIVLPGIMGTHLEVGRGRKRPGHGNRVWLDPFEIMRGGIEKIGLHRKGVTAEAMFEMFYGDLIEELENTHAVIPFPYDWRKPIQKTADDLKTVVAEALEKNPDQPVRLLAHSMGGLVTRAMIALHEDVWKEIVKRPGGRFIMLGTPNHGSHLMVETLLGKAGMIRKLARIDFAHRMQEILDIVADFPGATQLLPRPGFVDAGGNQGNDYLDASLWKKYKAINSDRWFGDNAAGIPTENSVKQSRELWQEVLCEQQGSGFIPRRIAPADRVSYVFGQGDNTACGIREENGRLRMIGTTEGDGTVSWQAGKLDFLDKKQYWYMPVEHGNLANAEKYFGAITELLQTGGTTQLGRLPVSRGAAALRSYDAGPTPYPSDEELIMSLMSSRPRRRKTIGIRPKLSVRVKAMDLRNAQLPVMCGHYVGDPMAGAEAQIDRHLVDGGLRQRQRLGIYAGDIGTSAIVLMPRNEEERKRGTHRGGVILGLGEMGKLSIHQVTETVRAGVLNYLLQVNELDASFKHADSCDDPLPEIGIASLLIGYNSTTLGEIENFVDAIVLGVCEANREFINATESDRWVCRLEFIELFMDTAITAAHAVKGLNTRLARDLQRLSIDVEPQHELKKGKGVRPRLYVSAGFGYWPRLEIVNADQAETLCSPECYETRVVSMIPEEVRRQLLESECPPASDDGGTDDRKKTRPTVVHAQHRPAGPVFAERLKYVFLSARARAEIEIQQSQPGLIEKLVEYAIRQPRFNAELSRTLFQLMVPLAFKATARDMERLHLLLDGYTANLPWEMLQADEEPMVLKTAMVRQLASARYRHRVHAVTSKTACIIADPSTRGFELEFGGKALPQLQGAVEEGQDVRQSLESANYQVTFIPSGSGFSDVMTRFFCNPSRILMIAAHGVFQATDSQGKQRTGVVLSDGQMLTAAEVGQLEAVPEIAFLNCCHLGKVDNAPFPSDVNKLAYSLSRELIEMGVRCVVAAGWAVDDQAARTFASSFFDAMLDGSQFGDAVHAARRKTYQKHPGINTWGAYQAYGDPVFVLEKNDKSGSGRSYAPVAVEELLASLDTLFNDIKYKKVDSYKDAREKVEDLLKAAPAGWGELASVQEKIGGIYGEFREEGFVAACEAYTKAISLEDEEGRVAIKTIEQLANLEARSAERLCNALSGKEHERCMRGEAMDRVKRAIKRLDDLFAVTGQDKPEILHFNRERYAVLGSAHKIKAGLHCKLGHQWGRSTSQELRKARDAYQAGEGSVEDPQFNPYAMLNRLHIDALLEQKRSTDGIIELAEECKQIARKLFRESGKFWDAVMVGDAELAIQLAKGKLHERKNEQQLSETYRNAMADVPRSSRQLDSVQKQLRLIADFLNNRDSGKRVRPDQAGALYRVIESLDAGAGEASE